MFKGINVENLNAFIRKNNFYLTSIENNKKSMIKAIDELNTCYEGRTLEFLFSKILMEKKNIESLTKAVQSYSSALYNAGIAYQKQDIKLQSQIQHSNFNL